MPCLLLPQPWRRVRPCGHPTHTPPHARCSQVIVNNARIVEANIQAKRRSQGEFTTPPDVMRNFSRRIKDYQRMYTAPTPHVAPLG